MAEGYTLLEELDQATAVNANDSLYAVKQNGDDVKVSVNQLKTFVTPPDADSLTPGIVNTDTQAFSGRKTFNSGIGAKDVTVVEDVTAGGSVTATGEVHGSNIPSTATAENPLTTEDYINSLVADTIKFTPQELTEEQKEQARNNIGVDEGGGGSALVPSITQEAYNDLTEEEKNNGQIREITDAPGNEIPFVILDDTITTASNVLSAQKVNELFGFELGQNENGHYLKCANGLLICWGTIASRDVTLPSQYKDIKYCVIPRSDGSAYGLQILTKNIDSMVLNNYQNAYQGEYFAIGYWK